MPSVDLTPAKLADMKQKAYELEILKQITLGNGNFYENDRKMHIALKAYHRAADPATVLAMVEEIEILKTALNLLLWEYYSTDLEQEDIDKLFKKQIEMAKKYRESEAGQ